MIGLDIILRRN
ncbi:unnamed protein product [Leptidea sinapis]|uniref:Uncharacterized protein n=1 Tax=Leptidea sinapis TaxID=189913 RepID=A0A5E4QII9_9NEOP|nr:unnamed protein product [Leptidea sinapis]